MKELFELASVILLSLGGGGVIVFTFSSWLGKVWASRLMAAETAKHSQDLERLREELSRNSESHKVKLRKSELIFEKEFEAASQLIALIRGFLPTYRHPHMDWYEACEKIAFDLEEIESGLDIFLSKHGAVLPTQVKEHLGSCTGIAADNKFEIASAQEMYVPDSAIKAVESIFKELWKAEEEMLNHVKSQVSI